MHYFMSKHNIVMDWSSWNKDTWERWN